METKNNIPKLCLVLNSKPRASATSSRYTIGGLDFFFKYSQADTAGGIKIYYDSKPYPYLMYIKPKMIKGTKKVIWSSVDELTEEAMKWCIDNQSAIIKVLKELDTYIKIEEKEWRKKDG